MQTAEALTAFEEFLARRGLTVSTLGVDLMIDALLDFYVSAPADDTEDGLGDAVFLEWGTYDWDDGAGRRFQYSLRRQFFVASTPPDDADDGIWELELQYRCAPDLSAEGLGAGGEMCDSRSDVAPFRAMLHEHVATAFVRANPHPFTLTFDQGG
jgi:hypothetical protein